jgi:hypothetical protein
LEHPLPSSEDEEGDSPTDTTKDEEGSQWDGNGDADDRTDSEAGIGLAIVVTSGEGATSGKVWPVSGFLTRRGQGRSAAEVETRVRAIEEIFWEI